MDAPPDDGIDVPEWKCHRPLEPEGASTMQITTVGLDLAKNVFQVHGVNRHGKVELRKQLKRDQVAAFFANLPGCLIGMEACSSAHHWARVYRPACAGPHRGCFDRAAWIVPSADRQTGRALESAAPAGRGGRGADQGWHRASDASRRLEEVPGIGPLTARLTRSARSWWAPSCASTSALRPSTPAMETPGVSASLCWATCTTSEGRPSVRHNAAAAALAAFFADSFPPCLPLPPHRP